MTGRSNKTRLNPDDADLPVGRPKGMTFEAPVSALSKWQPQIKAAAVDPAAGVINIYGMVGDYWGPDDITAAKVADVLTANAGKDITVNVNSPGGDFFEGVAIYNLLRNHDGDVNVRVIGIAASAAAILAMAGDHIAIAESGFLMIHNAWTVAVGNRNAMTSVADVLAQFDESQAGVFAKRSGKDKKEIYKMMDAETFVAGADAVKDGFADALLAADETTVEDSEKSEYNSALRRMDIALTKAGMPRSERRNLLKELTSGKPRAADPSDRPRAVNPENHKPAIDALKALVAATSS